MQGCECAAANSAGTSQSGSFTFDAIFLRFLSLIFVYHSVKTPTIAVLHTFRAGSANLQHTSWFYHESCVRLRILILLVFRRNMITSSFDFITSWGHEQTYRSHQGLTLKQFILHKWFFLVTQTFLVPKNKCWGFFTFNFLYSWSSKALLRLLHWRFTAFFEQAYQMRTTNPMIFYQVSFTHNMRQAKRRIIYESLVKFHAKNLRWCLFCIELGWIMLRQERFRLNWYQYV